MEEDERQQREKEKQEQLQKELERMKTDIKGKLDKGVKTLVDEKEIEAHIAKVEKIKVNILGQLD